MNMSSDKKAGAQFSFEVFPPKKFDKEGNPIPIESVYPALDALSALSPRFISVTYGAGGSENCANTLAVAMRIKNSCKVPVVAHLTCINLTKVEAENILTQFKASGVMNILALRGDKVAGVDYTNKSAQFKYAADLVKFIKSFDGDFNIYGACYPEGHIEAKSLADDITHLKEKIDAGVTTLLTQLFFDNGRFYDFCNLVRQAGIDAPIEAGIMPATNAASIKKMVGLSNAKIPKKLLALIDKYGDDKESMRRAGLDYAVEQIKDLCANGFNKIHLYTMNNPLNAKTIMEGASEAI